MELIAGVDSSTQSTKVVLCDLETGAYLGSGSAPHPKAVPPVSQQHPHAWMEALQQAWLQALKNTGAAAEHVRALSIAAQCHGLVALNDAFQVIRPAKLWNDTTSAPQMQKLLHMMSAENWVQKTGSVPTSAFTVSKLLWLKEHEPDHFNQTKHVLLPHDWLTYKLTGRLVTDRSEASGTGYFNAESNTYDVDILNLVDDSKSWESMLPSVLGPAEIAGTANTFAQELLGLRSDTIIGPGAGDQHASALGMGINDGDRVLSLGTSGVIFSSTSQPVKDSSGIVDGVANASGGYLPLVSTLNAAGVTDTFAKILGVNSQQFSALALAAEPKNMPVLSAYLGGERKPNLPLATATLAGITASVTREQIARAAIEGVIFGLKYGAEQLTLQQVPSHGRLLLTGGASRSSAYQQLTADAFGVPAYTSPTTESVAYGAAMQAAACKQQLPIETIRDQWAAPVTLAAEPKDVDISNNNYQTYLATASWRGADRK